jgi:hypothetical protein
MIYRIWVDTCACGCIEINLQKPQSRVSFYVKSLGLESEHVLEKVAAFTLGANEECSESTPDIQ